MNSCTYFQKWFSTCHQKSIPHTDMITFTKIRNTFVLQFLEKSKAEEKFSVTIFHHKLPVVVCLVNKVILRRCRRKTKININWMNDWVSKCIICKNANQQTRWQHLLVVVVAAIAVVCLFYYYYYCCCWRQNHK